MKFLKGTLTALATTAVMAGAPASADGLNLNIDLGSGTITLRGGDITINNGRLRGTFNNGQSTDNGKSCRENALYNYRNTSQTAADRQRYRQQIRACN
jgi:hypothetical protein